MQTGENEQGLRKILDMTRMISIVVLLLHFYFYCYTAFEGWGATAALSDKVLSNIEKTGLFSHFYTSKAFSLGLLCVSLIGAKGRKDNKATLRNALHYVVIGLILFFTSYFILYIAAGNDIKAMTYMATTTLGYALIMAGGTMLSRLLKQRLNDDVFNNEQETFPQEERLLENPYSVNLPAQYSLKGKTRKSWINLVNPFRGLLLMGSPGSGKTYFIIQHIIKQQIQKGFSMLLYDFKYDDLSKIAYNYFIKNKQKYPGQPAFYNINFDDLNRTHRCNPLDASTMSDITDAAESSRTILLGLNRDWTEKQGDFFVESPINFVTALIWFLCRYKRGRYCTWAHVIELAQVPYKKLFSVLRTAPELSSLITPFINAFLHGAMEQLEGQIASATISLAKLSSPQLYYVISGNDFSLDINNPAFPKIVCLGNNPQKTTIYGAILSVYINTITRMTNKKGMCPMGINLDEFSSIIANSIDKTIATGRSNKIAITIAIQDYSQLKLSYGKEFAEVVVNTCGNLICGQVSGESAKHTSERFPKIMQDRQSMTLTSTDTNFTMSKQLEQSVTPARISSLSSGEFVGIVADNPGQEITLKAFCSKIINDHDALKKEDERYLPLPEVRKVTTEMVLDNYLQIKKDIAELIDTELERMMDTPELEHLLIKKG